MRDRHKRGADSPRAVQHNHDGVVLRRIQRDVRRPALKLVAVVGDGSQHCDLAEIKDQPVGLLCSDGCTAGRRGYLTADQAGRQCKHRVNHRSHQARSDWHTRGFVLKCNSRSVRAGWKIVGRQIRSHHNTLLVRSARGPVVRCQLTTRGHNRHPVVTRCCTPQYKTVAAIDEYGFLPTCGKIKFTRRPGNSDVGIRIQTDSTCGRRTHR